MSAPGPVRKAAARDDGQMAIAEGQHMVVAAVRSVTPKSVRQGPKSRRLERAAELRRMADELDEHSEPTEAQAEAYRQAAADAFWQAMNVSFIPFGLAFKKGGTRGMCPDSVFSFDDEGAWAVREACQDVVETIFAQRVTAGCAPRQRSAALRAQAARLDDAVQRCLARAAAVDPARGAA